MTKPPPKPENPRTHVIFTPEELQKLDDWQFEHRHRTRTAAIKALMEIGYEATKRLSGAPARKPKGSGR